MSRPVAEPDGAWPGEGADPSECAGPCRERRRIERHPEISVIIPALDEELTIPAAIASARDAATEVIVVDGGSTDGTAKAAAEAGARVILSPRGRGVQMNAGAREARGRILLFLHADSILPAGFVSAVVTVLRRPGVAGAAFRLRIDGASRALRMIERWANRRARWFGLPYGDQALAVRRQVFSSMDGFREIPLMEDFDLVRRLRHYGRVVMIDRAVRTSPRRWQRLGVLRLTLVHQACIVGFLLGVAPMRLARWREGGAARRGRATAGLRPMRDQDAGHAVNV